MFIEVELNYTNERIFKMASLNRVTLIGRLGTDPDLRSMQSGEAVCNFSVATSETWKDKNTGEKKEKTEWHKVTAYRKLGEICGEYLKKGSQCYVEGKLQTRKYEKDGVTRYTTEIIADQVQFLGGKSEQGRQYTGPESVGDDSEIPF